MQTLLAFRHTILMLALTATLLFIWRYSPTHIAEVAFVVAGCCAVGALMMFFIDIVWQHYDSEFFEESGVLETRDDN